MAAMINIFFCLYLHVDLVILIKKHKKKDLFIGYNMQKSLNEM